MNSSRYCFLLEVGSGFSLLSGKQVTYPDAPVDGRSDVHYDEAGFVCLKGCYELG